MFDQTIVERNLGHTEAYIYLLRPKGTCNMKSVIRIGVRKIGLLLWVSPPKEPRDAVTGNLFPIPGILVLSSGKSRNEVTLHGLFHL